MPTLNIAYQEHERHFSGIWRHFPECQVFLSSQTITPKLAGHSGHCEKQIIPSYKYSGKHDFLRPSMASVLALHLCNLRQISASFDLFLRGSHFDFLYNVSDSQPCYFLQATMTFFQETMHKPLWFSK